MEENFKKQTARPRCDISRTLLGYAHQGICIAYLAKAPCEDCDLPQSLLEATHQEDVSFLGAYYVPQSLSHFGLVDQLAPASAMDEFVEYTKSLEQKAAHACFGKIKELFTPERLTIQVVYSDNDWEKLLQKIQRDFKEILIVEPTTLL